MPSPHGGCLARTANSSPEPVYIHTCGADLALAPSPPLAASLRSARPSCVCVELSSSSAAALSHSLLRATAFAQPLVLRPREGPHLSLRLTQRHSFRSYERLSTPPLLETTTPARQSFVHSGCPAWRESACLDRRPWLLSTVRLFSRGSFLSSHPAAVALGRRILSFSRVLFICCGPAPAFESPNFFHGYRQPATQPANPRLILKRPYHRRRHLSTPRKMALPHSIWLYLALFLLALANGGSAFVLPKFHQSPKQVRAAMRDEQPLHTTVLMAAPLPTAALLSLPLASGSARLPDRVLAQKPAEMIDL